MKPPITHTVLALSLAINVIALGGAVRTVYARGGWEYLRTALEGAREGNGSNPDAANYAHRESLFELLPKPKSPIVFAGDSLSQGCEWSEFYPGAVNRGIGGDTSAGFLRRVRTITEMKPRAVFLMIGSNDLFNLHLRPEQTVGNVRAIIAEMRESSPETLIYIESNLPTWVVQKNTQARAVNQGLRSLANGKTVVYVDLYSAFLEKEILKPEFTSDGGHLNGQGYLLWKHLIDPYVERLLLGPRASNGTKVK